MRAYYFGNMYLSSIQQGIQAAHVTHELFNKYYGTFDNSEVDLLRDWSENHKTMILLNAGYGENIHALAERFDHSENTFPWAKFHEEEASLDGAITCVGIVLPEKIYETAALLRTGPFRDREALAESIQNTGVVELTPYQGIAITHELSKWEFEFIQELNNYGMAS